MIGVFDELPFINQGEIDIDPGSLVFNYTDGLIDYESQGPKLWDEDKLLAFILQNGSMEPDKLNDILLEHLSVVTKGKAIDDITVLTLRIF